MYKTVRHGENSLQYTILPQEDGVTNVKPRKSRKKGKTAAILTVTVILICSIIATAVLVPLLLTSDLVVLPAAFQKFSVSSLRRSHSGNHYVVVAKKPHGWINSHHNPAHPPMSNKTYANNNNNNNNNINNNNNNNNNAYKSQDETLNMQIKTTTTTATSTPLPTTKIIPTTTTTVSTTTTTTTTEKPTTILSNEVETNNVGDKKLEDNVLWAYEPKYTEVPEKNYLDITTTTTKSSKSGESGGFIKLLNPHFQTTSSPWYNQRWSFGNSVSDIGWSGNNTRENFMSIVGGIATAVLCLVIIFTAWLVRKRNLRNDNIKNSTDVKADDKDTLLKESTAGSEEE